MTLYEARNILRSIVAGYFGDGHVFYAEVKKPVSVEPYITVKTADTVRPLHASKVMDNEGYQKSYRELASSFEINLYTKGRNPVEGGDPVYLNTAINDMNNFVDYLDSDEMIEEMNRQDIVIVPTGTIRDLSALQNGSSSYQYRALLEGEIRFMDVSYGRYGMNQLDMIPDDSGGGSTEFVTDPYVIEETEIIQEDTNE